MMYETDVGSGEYQVSTDSEWLGDEYIFNETLSKCENGGTLSWNNDTQRIVMQTNSSDKCYAYFDKYNMPQVTEVTATEVTSNSITVSVTASGGDGSIVSYHYSINNGEYISSSGNSYTFENLDAETSYDISVYVSDSNGRDSNVYNADVMTDIGLITFNINNILYYAENGMTWGQWVSSAYNTSDLDTYCVDGTGPIVYGAYVLHDSSYAEVFFDDLIIADAIYSHDTSGMPEPNLYVCI